MTADLPLEAALDNPLWRFAIDFYARPGVGPACLVLQDQAAADVNIVLLSIFVRVTRGTALSADDLAAADAAVREWRDNVVRPLRSVRRYMKHSLCDVPASSAEPLRERIGAMELKAEQMELSILYAWLNEHGVNGAETADPVEAAARYFAASPDLLPADVVTAVRILSRAAHDVAAANQPA